MSNTILGIHEKEVVAAMLTSIEQDCYKVDTHARYDEMLDECFSFESVGGIFASMCPSRVLKECDPVAYRCGHNDWLDGERDILIEINGDYYRAEDVRESQERFVFEMNDQLEEMESELSELELESDEGDCGKSQSVLNEIEKAKDAIARQQSAIKACEEYAF